MVKIWQVKKRLELSQSGDHKMAQRPPHRAVQGSPRPHIWMAIPEYSEKANQPWPLPSVLGNGDGGRTGSNTWNGHRVPTTVPGVLPTSSMFQSHGNRNDDESNGDFTGSGVDSQGLDILTWLLWKLWAQQVREERTLCLKHPHYRLHLFWG